jgi:GntR family transcriptional regulator
MHLTWRLDKNRGICPQICEQLCARIVAKEFLPGQRLMSVREVALAAGVNPNTVQRAYAELERQGVIYCVKGRGNFVAGINALKDKQKEELKPQLLELVKKAKKADVTENEFTELVKQFYSQQ